MEVKKESPNSQRSKPLDLNDVEMIGNPSSPKPDRPDVHMIANERRNAKDPQPNEKPNAGADSDADAKPTQPLLEPDRGRQKPPLAGPEIDDLEGDDRKSEEAEPYPGIDDGLLEPADKKPNGHPNGEFDPDEDKEHRDGDGVTTDDGKWWPHGGDEPDFAYGDLRTMLYNTHSKRDGINGFGPRAGFDPERPISPMFPPGKTSSSQEIEYSQLGTSADYIFEGNVVQSIPDVNTYQQKKNLAQGMMDLALLSANANQLRYVLESSSVHPYFYSSIIFISMSILLQIAVGVGLILNSRYNVKDDKDICKADKINNMTVLGIFLITIVNVFIASFSVATPTSTTSTAVQTVGTG